MKNSIFNADGKSAGSSLDDEVFEKTHCYTVIETRFCPRELSRRSSIGWSMDGFKIQKVIGEGAISTVVQATCIDTGISVAVKIYHRDKLNGLNVRQISREIEIQSSLSHPNIIKLYAAFEDVQAIYLVQEFAAGGDLYSELSRHGGRMLEAYVLKAVMVPVLQAITYLHDQGIIHRDIKPENILLTGDGKIKITDFGLSINSFHEKPKSRVGTLDYMPPEIVALPCPSSHKLCHHQSLPRHKTTCAETQTQFLQHLKGASLRQATSSGLYNDNSKSQCNSKIVDTEKESRQAKYGLAVDIWSCGILAYELLVGGPPFEARSKDATYARILHADPFYPECLSFEAKDFMRQTLQKNPENRPTAGSLFGHPWLQAAILTSSRSVLVSPDAGVVLVDHSNKQQNLGTKTITMPKSQNTIEFRRRQSLSKGKLQQPLSSEYCCYHRGKNQSMECSISETCHWSGAYFQDTSRLDSHFNGSLMSMKHLANENMTNTAFKEMDGVAAPWTSTSNTNKTIPKDFSGGDLPEKRMKGMKFLNMYLKKLKLKDSRLEKPNKSLSRQNSRKTYIGTTIMRGSSRLSISDALQSIHPSQI